MSREIGNSLTARLLVGMILPTAGLALILAFGGTLIIQNIVENVSDRLLDASARAIADTLAYEDGDVTLDLPLSAFGMLENDARDNVYYSVRRGGELVTGYPDLPIVADFEGEVGVTIYRYATYRSARIRMIAVSRRVPRIAEPIVVQVAETLVARNRLRQRMLVGLAVVEALLIGMLLALLPLAVRWGLQPLSRVREQLDHRETQDFTPLNIDEAPVELRSFLRAFNDMLQRLYAAMEGLRQFTADASHQMRTPLSILRTHVEILRSENKFSDSGRESLKDIDTATRRLQRLLTQLLALARAQNTGDDLGTHAKAIDLTSLVRSVAEEMVPLALRQGVELEFKTSIAPVEVLTIGALATELLKNLVDNAIRYNRAGGSVTLSIEPGEGEARIVVEDDGPGIPATERENVLKRFYRLHHDDEKRQGSGLGLAIVKALSDSIGAGVIIGDRGLSTGLRVEVIFPAAQSIASVTGQ